MVRRRSLFVMLAAVVACTGLAIPAFADPAPPSPPAPERHTISVGAPADAKTTRDRAAKARKAAKRRTAKRDGATALDVAAGSVTPVGTGADAAAALAGALVADGSLEGARYVTTPPTSGTNGVGHGIGGVSGEGALLTTGDATLAPEPNDFLSSGRDSGGGKVRGESAYDVTVLQVDLDVPAWASCLTFEMKFFSEEFPEFVRSAYNDGFVAELDRSTWTTDDSTILAPDNFAFDPSGNVISTNTTGLLAMSAAAASGTTYDGATPLMKAGTPVTGGAHKIYLSVFDQHDAVYDSAVLLRGLKYTQDTGAECGTGAKPVTKPVIFVPGIMGTKLVDESGTEWWPGGTKLLNPTDSHLDNIMLNDDGLTDAKGNGVYGSEVIMKILGLKSIYQDTVTLLKDAGYVLGDIEAPQPGENLFLSPVDWRKSATVNKNQLLDRIERIRDATGSDRVNIIAHSQGGLVVNAAMRDARSAGKVNRISTIATPYLGAAKALGVLHYKTPCVIDFVGGRCLLNRNEAAKITRNFPGFLELLPSDNYHRVVEPPVNRVPGGPLTPDQVRNLLSDKNLTLIDRARAWHQQADEWKPADARVGLTRLIGDGVTTVVSFDEFAEEHCDEKFGWWRTCAPGTGVLVNWSDHGDGTVPLGSARLTPELRGDSVVLEPYSGIGHADLPNKSQVIASAVYAIQGEGPTAGRLAALRTADDAQQLAGAGGLTGTEVMVRGPVNLLLTDSAGRRTGFADPSTEIEMEDIPGSSYAAGTGPYKQISAFLTQGKAAGEITTTANGYVYIRLRTWVNGVVTSTIAYEPILTDPNNRITFAGAGVTVPATRVAVLPCDICPAQNPLPTVTGGGADDETPPDTTVNLTYDTFEGKRRVRITAGGTDAGGAGVERIEWAIESSDPGDRTQYATYAQPFYWIKPAGSTGTWTLHLRSIDAAGNIDGSYVKTALDL
ncbi:choice-of-anchor L domain-containing protein [Sphaerisporangium sp. NPDC005289]|uniref:choice-of-anchor L domain-containing protein n=1 Tax=Sphaerisporangium sp. NPDC005289 TaxID=3155247 RepID=UPI0033A4E62B